MLSRFPHFGVSSQQARQLLSSIFRYGYMDRIWQGGDFAKTAIQQILADTF